PGAGHGDKIYSARIFAGWDVPCPSMVKNLYKASLKESTDPRFLKLRPVFRCSKLKIADRQSIPLTMEWSRSAPCDLILVGCHDGMVAIWKFSAEDFPQDSRPLLCFSADDVPIRAVSWAPSESGSESANLMVTAGHEGLKFWDIRDPYRPLWDLNPVQRIILSLDWLQHPSCLIFSLDDGTIRTLSLSKAAYNSPVIGKPSDGSKQGVLHSYYRSQFAIWSVQVSPVTGLAAYCCADGSTLCFQLTARLVDKEKSRDRTPHFLCGALMEIENTLTIETPLPYTAVAELPRHIRGLPPRSINALAEEPQVQDDDPSENSGYRDRESSATRKKNKSRTSRSEKLLNETQRVDPSGAVREEKQEDLKTEVTQSNENFLVFPPKIVAMHRVRWNINKGSERWLCYGGAAGIIRCQEIGFPSGF
ncbi:hypothetical protein Taro_004935, partial [Colocasia esculenta]|nr:hypothetical protein [Colocasia esculenta]